MEIIDQLTKVLSSDTYREWKSGTPKAFLSTLFVLIDGSKQDWQAGFYDPDSEHTTSFVIGERIEMIPPSMTFKEPEQTVIPLDAQAVKLDLRECLAIAQQHQRVQFPKETPTKIIAILQHLPVGLVYNVTYVTPSLSTLNIKVDAQSREIKAAALIPIISFRR